MVWAWAQEITATEKLILLALADHSDDTGYCWPGQKGLAVKCGVSRETVNRTIKSLESKGKLQIIQQFDNLDRPMANRYQLGSKQGGMVIDDHRGSDFKSQGYVTQDHTNLSEEESVIEPKRESAPAALPRPRSKGVLPDSFFLTETAREFFKDHNPIGDADREFEKFVAYHQAKGTVMANWDAAWRTWAIKSSQYQPANGQSNFGSFGHMGPGMANLVRNLGGSRRNN